MSPSAEVMNISNRKDEPIEAYQHAVYKVEGLTPGVHTLAP